MRPEYLFGRPVEVTTTVPSVMRGWNRTDAFLAGLDERMLGGDARLFFDDAVARDVRGLADVVSGLKPDFDDFPQPYAEH